MDAGRCELQQRPPRCDFGGTVHAERGLFESLNYKFSAAGFGLPLFLLSIYPEDKTFIFLFE